MLIAIYLNDHLAGATAGRELARRAANTHRSSSLGEFFEGLAAEIDEDRDALISIMRALAVDIDRLKVASGWILEKAGRLKLNGRWFSQSPLSVLVELEGLSLGVRGKLALWRALSHIEDDLADLDPETLRSLEIRAERQIDELEKRRLRAATSALL